MAKNDTSDIDDVIATKALLVRVRITVFTARVRDERASQTLEKSMGAEVGLGIYTKSLVSKGMLNKVMSGVKQTRRMYEEITLPWGNDGTRLLPTEQWGEFNDRVEARRAEFWISVDEFLDGYEEHRKSAKRRMGKLFKDSDYPPTDKVRRRFSFDVEYAPIPVAGDFRVDLSNGARDSLHARVTEQAAAAAEAAQRDMFYRLADAVGGFYTQITGEDWVGVRGKTFEHLHKLAGLLPSLNVGNDPKLNEILKILNEQILVYDAGQLRDHKGSPTDITAKKRATKAAMRIIERIKKVDGIDVVSLVETRPEGDG